MSERSERVLKHVGIAAGVFCIAMLTIYDPDGDVRAVVGLYLAIQFIRHAPYFERIAKREQERAERHLRREVL